MTWVSGAITDSGVIYCPHDDDRGILKIDTNTDNVTELDVNLLPERGGCMWSSCAAALDGCIYFMPDCASCIMKLDPNNNDAMSSVGDDLGDGEFKFNGTVVGIDGCVYGMPSPQFEFPDEATRILKYDPSSNITSFFGDVAHDNIDCVSGGVLARDGCIYVLDKDRVLKIETKMTNNSHCFVGSIIQSDHNYGDGWGDAILGIDGCIYWPPLDAKRTLKYDPYSNQISLVGDNFESEGQAWTFNSGAWKSGALATDGVVYCIALNATQVLTIDPWGEFLLAMKTNMEEHPEELGFIFRINAKDNNSTDTETPSNRTNFDCAVTKFGVQKVLEIVQEHMPAADEVCAVCGLYPFMIAASASCEESPLSVVYFLLRQVPSLINCNGNSVV